MNTLVNRSITLLAVVGTVSFILVASPAHAQRDAGAKARGEFGTGFWSTRPLARSYSPGFVESRRSFSYEPRVESRRTYSYQPAPVVDLGRADAIAVQPQVDSRRFSYEPAAPIFLQPRVEQRSGRVRNPIERRQRPGIGFWE